MIYCPVVNQKYHYIVRVVSNYYYYLLFTQDSLFSTYCTVINEGPAIEVLIVCKAPIWATEFTPLNQTSTYQWGVYVPIVRWKNIKKVWRWGCMKCFGGLSNIYFAMNFSTISLINKWINKSSNPRKNEKIIKKIKKILEVWFFMRDWTRDWTRDYLHFITNVSNNNYSWGTFFHVFNNTPLFYIQFTNNSINKIF